MARYNSSSATTTITGTATVTSPYSGAFTGLTGTAPYTVTLPSPVLFPGTTQTFYNATAGTVTLSTPSGLFAGLGASGTGTLAMLTNTVTAVTSDGVNYIVLSEDGSALVATSGSFTGNVDMSNGSATVTISPQSLTMSPASGVINNMSVGATTRSSGAFTSLAANSTVLLTANISSSSTSTGSLVVTGGIGASGTIYAGGFNGNLTGTIQTASQTNITAIGSNNAIRIDGSGNVAINRASPVLKLHVVANTSGALALDLIDTTSGSSLMDAASTNNMIYLRTAFNSNPGGLANAGAKWGIAFTGHPAGDNANYPITANSSALGKSASIYAVSEDTSAGYNRQVGLSFWTSAFDANQTERLRIRNDGFIGIATSIPAAKLTVKATDGATGGIRLAHSTDNGPVVNIYQSGSDGYIDLYTGENPTTLRTHISSYGDSYFAPAANGKVGIGITTPGSKLDVRTAITSDASVAAFINNHGTDRRSYIYIGSNPGADWKVGKDFTNAGDNRFFIADTSNVERLVIQPSSGNVGIGRTDPSYKLDVNGSLRSAYSFRNYVKSHSSTNSNSGGYQTSTNITQIGDQMYEYSFYFGASTGGYPTCPYSYWVMCPVQKQDTGTLGWAEVTIRGTHRGMWGTGYDDYASIVVGSGSDGGGIWVKEWKNGDANNGSNRIRVGWMNYDGVYNEGTNYNSGYNLGSWTGNNIGQSYYKMPLLLKIYTNCGADKEYIVSVRTSNPDVLGPPYKGPLVVAPNTAPTSAMYW
jgi:hypothetical protein